jgi:hypothetical protein
MDACPACTASLVRHGKIHCTSPTCVWVKCTSCLVVIDNNTKAYSSEKPLMWGNPDRYLKGGESVCQPPSTPKSSETKHSPSTTQTDQQP